MKRDQSTYQKQHLQKTIARPAEATGIGLFSGEKTFIRILPAPVNSGIVFTRIDLPEKPEIPALLDYVKEGTRCTMLQKDGVVISTVEHILSAIYAIGIDNMYIEIMGRELPAGDGSSTIFTNLLQNNIQIQNEPRSYLTIQKPVYLSTGDTVLIALPSDSFTVKYTLSYPHNQFIGSQYYSLEVTKEKYLQEIASCRTFSLYEDLVPLWNKGLLKHAGLQNGVVIKDNFVLNPEGLRYSNEMVRHKILDLIGDLSLIGKAVFAKIVAIRSGHLSNIAFARKIAQSAERVCSVS